ncbi:MAG TPA: helix-turn-helix domain-containing protein [Candidatus Eisenbacteria bacterium]|jgi:transcriptional regulator GlxA family with amidase domain|nr:helix-turn-helix domain-containing protein [Candidatus Eisenbacteria bacterium]
MARHRVVILAMPCAEVVEVPGILDIFYGVNQRTGRGGGSDPFYDVEVVAPTETICSWQGLRLVADRPYRSLRGSVDTLIVTGIDDPRVARLNGNLTSWVARVAGRAGRVVGLCTGTFVLAAAGLLNGRRATTHWAFCGELARRFPKVLVQPDPIYVRDGRLYTSAGATAGLDLVLAMVEEDLGRRLALAVARWMVLFLKRPGGQAQFSEHLAAQMGDREPLRELQAWVLSHPHADLTVDALAHRVHMSPRHFQRVFVREVGTTPGRFVARARIEAARRLLEETRRGVPEVAARCGFGSPETMRVAFRQALSVSPAGYRARFATARTQGHHPSTPSDRVKRS